MYFFFDKVFDAVLELSLSSASDVLYFDKVIGPPRGSLRWS